MKPFVEADLLLLDDLFLTRQLPLPSADILQSLLHQRYKLRRSTLITSSRILDDWKSCSGDAVLTTAIQANARLQSLANHRHDVQLLECP